MGWVQTTALAHSGTTPNLIHVSLHQRIPIRCFPPVSYLTMASLLTQPMVWAIRQISRDAGKAARHYLCQAHLCSSPTEITPFLSPTVVEAASSPSLLESLVFNWVLHSWGVHTQPSLRELKTALKPERKGGRLFAGLLALQIIQTSRNAGQNCGSCKDWTFPTV